MEHPIQPWPPIIRRPEAQRSRKPLAHRSKRVIGKPGVVWKRQIRAIGGLQQREKDGAGTKRVLKRLRAARPGAAKQRVM